MLVTACAGDLKDARKAAKLAASSVGDMQQTTLNAIDEQRAYRQIEVNRVSELLASGKLNLASVNAYRSTWQAADMKDAQEIYDAIADSVSAEDLAKSAPFVLLAPQPEFNAPAIDQKSFADLIEKFTKLSEGLSPIDRANALKPFVEVVVKAFGDSVKGAKKSADSSGTDGGNADSVEALKSNEKPVAALTSALSPQ
jgi:hypothetical protein